MDCSPPGFSVHGILQARILEWVAIPFFSRSSQPRDWTQVSHVGRQILYHLSHQGSISISLDMLYFYHSMYQFGKIYNKNWKLKSVQLRSSKSTLAHIVEINTQGQGQRLRGATSHPRSGGCAGARGPRGAIPLWRSGRVAVRRYPSSKVRISCCALLEQPWRDTPRPR